MISKMEKFKEKFDKILINTLGISQEDIKPDTHFINDLGADSLDLVELTMKFEKEFNITIPDIVVEKLLTIGDAEEYLKTTLTI